MNVFIFEVYNIEKGIEYEYDKGSVEASSIESALLQIEELIREFQKDGIKIIRVDVYAKVREASFPERIEWHSVTTLNPL